MQLAITTGIEIRSPGLQFHLLNGRPCCLRYSLKFQQVISTQGKTVEVNWMCSEWRKMLFHAPLEARERGEDQRGHGDK